MGGTYIPPINIKTINYSSIIASVGHASTQEPHDAQAPASITYMPSPSLIASTGHAPAQEPQDTHASVITYAIIIYLHLKFTQRSKINYEYENILTQIWRNANSIFKRK